VKLVRPKNPISLESVTDGHQNRRYKRGKLLARTFVSTNPLATTANGGQGYIYNALSREDRENSKGTIVAPWVHSESATCRCIGQNHRAANYDSAH